MRISDDRLHERTIIAADGQVIGEVSGLILESDDWRVLAIQVTLRKDIAEQLGAGRSVFRRSTLEIPVELVQSVGPTVVLAVPSERLRGLVGEEHAPAPAQ
jgi:sporulation protein YlmC with PRC-barrel domain